jgi:hypothetical protein
MSFLEVFIQAARKAALRRTADATPKTSFVFQQPNSVSNAEYRAPGYGLLHCPHGKPYISPCSHCRRGAAEANANLAALLAKF